MGWLRDLFGGGFQSGDYWARRYRKGRSSGAGSYGKFADYKAEVINGLVAGRNVGSVIEFGSGDGNQASLYRFGNYCGVDVVPQVVLSASSRFADRPGWKFLTTAEYAAAPVRAELAMSLDVIYHLVEDAVYEAYMRDLVAAAGKYLLVYASDRDEPTRDRHVRHRAYSEWLARNAPEFALVQEWDNPHALKPGGNSADGTFAFFRLYERQ